MLGTYLFEGFVERLGSLRRGEFPQKELRSGNVGAVEIAIGVLSGDYSGGLNRDANEHTLRLVDSCKSSGR